ncbi:protein Snq2p [Monosporozyma servazzii]
MSDNFSVKATATLSDGRPINSANYVDEFSSESISKGESLSSGLSSRSTGEENYDQSSYNAFDAAKIFDSFVKDANEQGIGIRKTGVTLEDVGCEGHDRSALEGSTFGDILCLPYTIYRKYIKNRHEKKMKTILRQCNGLAQPGEMVLVLGRPSAGCSSFLKVTAGIIDQFAGGTTGEVTYDGIPQRAMMKHFKSDIIYNGELDVHFPYLTVQQTLDFAISCKIPAKRVDNISREDYIASKRELYANIFGLVHTYQTKVGNDFVKGISGGERKRVSIAEALAANGSVYCWDNATRGLDASTALEYARAIRIMTHSLESVAFITIYQASENIYETFDKVTVLHSGRQIYFGKIGDAKHYFEKMGYDCPPRQVTAEFLTSLTDPNGYHIMKQGLERKVPRTADEFEQYWLNSPEYSQLRDDITTYKKETNTAATRALYADSIAAEKSKGARKKSYYTVSYWEQVRLCTRRGFQRIYGNKVTTLINITAAIIQAFVSGSLYYDTPSSTNGAFSRGGVLFFCLLYYSLMGLANITFEHRQILQKHKGYSLYHPSAEALGNSIAGFPFRMIGLTLFLIIIYFLSGLNTSASSFFIVYLFLTMCSEAITSLFEFISAGCDTMAQAESICGMFVLSIAMYSTYMIQLPSMHPWFKWISYILPIRYAFESMLNAEFHGRHMDCSNTLIPMGPGYENVTDENRACAFIGSQPGQSYVLGDDYLRLQYEYEYKHTWRNFGIMWCFLLGFFTLKCVVTEFKRPVKSGGDALVFKKGSKRVDIHDDEESPKIGIEGKEKYVSSSTEASDNSLNVFQELKSKYAFLWRKVCFTIPYDGSQRQLLDDVSGYCLPGTLTALMGESGSGKTTLLNTLAQRNVGIITGDMLVNGRPIDSSFQRRAGYVQQQDIHIAELTVRESLIFSARMRRAQHVPDSEKIEYAEKVIQILNMEEYVDALVGEVGSGLNVEQRKKLSIGVELVAKPDILLFLDEPTSGLDSQSAWAIIQLLRKLASAGQSILCTIHQPSATLFEQFDRLLLLKKGGQTVYFGDIGKNSSAVVSYFERNGARKCSPRENPAEYILEAIGAGATASVKEDWHEFWLNSHEYTESERKVSELINGLSSKKDEFEIGKHASEYATSYPYQCKYVLQRTTITFWRSLNYIISKMMLMTIGGLYVGFTFYDPGTSYTGLQNTLFAVFISIVISAPAMNQIQAHAIDSRDLYEVRESKSNMFHWSLLLLTQYVSEIPYHLLFGAIFFVSSYFPLKNYFEASASAVYYLNYAIMFQLYYIGMGLMVLYMSPNLQSANVILGLLLSFMIAFCGVVQPPSLMSGFWTFMWKVSPYTYFVQNLIGIALHEKPVVCSKKELSYFQPPNDMTCGNYMEAFLSHATGYIVNPDATSECAYCIYSVGDEYLSHISASYSYLWRNFGIYFAYILFNIVGMVLTYYLFHVKGISFFKLDKIKSLLVRKKK